MPSSFSSFSNGDVIQASHVSELQNPIKNLERGASFYGGLSTGTSTAYTVTVSPAPDNPHQSGMIVNFKVHVANAVGAPNVSLNVNGVGAKPILKGGGQSLAANDLKANQLVSVIYDAVAAAFNLVASSVGALDDLSDVVISSPSSGQVVRHNGTNFVNANLAATDLPTGIDAAKIGGGLVSNTEFGYLDGVTSAIQTQINGKASTSHTHAATDITSGTLALARGGTGANLSATGGTGQFLRQSTAGAAVTVSVLTATDMPTGIDAAKIGGGLVSNTEFGYLDGVTSAIQTQINGKSATSHTHAAADIVSGQVALARGGTGADLSASGGTGQFLRQDTAGAAVTVSVLTATDMPTGIDAAKIGDGLVSNTEFGYLDGVTSAIQTQLNGKAATSHTHAAADITSGVLNTARLGTGTASSSTFLRGDGTWAPSIPVGAVMPYAGPSAPAGWLLCAGQYVSRTTYGALFTALGGDPGNPFPYTSTTFSLPDLRGRVAAGLDTMGGSAANRLTSSGSGISGNTMNGQGGLQNHTLITGEMPNHKHAFTVYSTQGSGSSFVPQAGYPLAGLAGFDTTAVGGDQPHYNCQPTIVLNYIIYAGV